VDNSSFGNNPADWCPPLPPERPVQDRRHLIDSRQTASALCHLGQRPLVITGIIRRLLISHFANSLNIEDPDLKTFIWQNNLATGILIESVQRWIGSLVEKRPAVLLKRNAYRNMRVLLNDRSGTDEQGNEEYLTLWVGSHTLFCIQETGASCEILATEVQRELTQFAPVVKQRLDLVKFHVTEVGEASEVEESTQNFLIPITVGWAYQEKWKVIPEALAITAINFNIQPHEI
jgi:hypothetical protein